MKIAGKKEKVRRKGLIDRLRRQIKRHRQQIKVIEKLELELKILCSEFIFCAEIEYPRQPVGEYPDAETKRLRGEGLRRLRRYREKLGTVGSVEEIELRGKIRYIEKYLEGLERDYRFSGLRQSREVVNRGRKGYSWEEVARVFSGLIAYAAGVTHEKFPSIEEEDLIQEGNLLLVRVYDKKGGDLGFDSFKSYFKACLWRAMSQMIEKEKKPWKGGYWKREKVSEEAREFLEYLQEGGEVEEFGKSEEEISELVDELYEKIGD